MFTLRCKICEMSEIIAGVAYVKDPLLSNYTVYIS